MKKAVLLVGHGSKLSGSSDALNQVLESLRRKEPSTFFQAAFLEIQPPNIPQGIELCLNQGAREVIVIPYFVQAGKHVVEDIPRIVSETQARHAGQHIYLAEYLSFDPRIVSVVEDRIRLVRESLKTV
ncbi:MAG: CbiX/SirB N-terminal domain-containing protein [Candidatus Omnitrophica bacterium]|nr:CbiX/SirB N-terminal domain-containing protein [Candidatus Omnitrophota bacterium]